MMFRTWKLLLLVSALVAGTRTGYAQVGPPTPFDIMGEVKKGDSSTPPTGRLVGGEEEPTRSCISASEVTDAILFVPPTQAVSVFPGPRPFLDVTYAGDPGPVVFAGSTCTYTTWTHLVGGTEVTEGYIVNFYLSDRDELQCEDGSCSGAFDLTLYARYGTVKGRITLEDGTPVKAGTMVAAEDPLGWPTRTTGTDPDGYYNFASTTTPLDDYAHVIGLAGLEIPLENNWGLRVTQVGFGEPGAHTWRIKVGSKSQEVVVHSSTAVTVDLTVAPEDVVPLPEEPGPRPEGEDGPEEGDEPPDEPEPPGCSCPPCPPSAVGQPVSVLSGNVFFDQTDARMNGARLPLVFGRSYNSRNAYNGLGGAFGRGWTHSFEKRLRVPWDRLVILTKGDGNHLYFTDPEGDGSFGPYNPPTERSRIQKQGELYIRYFESGGHETFDAQGRLTSQVDGVGNATMLNRDQWGRLRTVVAPGSRSYTLDYGNDGLVSQISGPMGVLATYEYESGLLSRVRYPDGRGHAFAYDDVGQVLAVVDPTGKVTEKHAYAGGRGISSELADGRERLTLSYGAGLTTVTDAIGNATNYHFAVKGRRRRVTKVEGPCPSCGGIGGGVQEWTYTDAGRVESYKNGLGKTTSFAYNALGHLETKTDALQRPISRTLNAQGRILTRTVPGNRTTTLTWVAPGPRTIQSQLGHTTTIDYDDLGRVETVTDPRSKVWTYTFTPQGDLEKVKDPLEHTTRFEYDLMGRRTKITNALGHVTRIEYNAGGNVAKVIAPNGSETKIEYDRAGRRTAVIDPRGRRTSLNYDGYGRLGSEVDPSGNMTRYGYDLRSNLTSITDARGRTTTFAYNEYNQLWETTYPGGRKETFTYDDAGRPKTRTDRKGVVTTYVRDDLGRLRDKVYSNGAPTVSFTYNDAGELESASNEADVLSFGYDPDGRVMTEASTRLQSFVSSTRDPMGSRETLSLDGVFGLTYGYDDASRLTSITRQAMAFEFGYDDANRRESLTFPNGIATSYSHDTVSRLTEVKAMFGPTTIARATYALDAAGNRVGKSTTEYDETYAYDLVDRLTRVERTGAGADRWVFGYDAVGNRNVEQRGTTTSTMTVNDRNELVSRTGGGELVWRGQLSEPGSVSFTSATVNGHPARMLPGNQFEATLPVTVGTNHVTIRAIDQSGNLRTNTYEVEVGESGATYTYDLSGNLASKVEAGATWTYEWTVEDQLKRVLKDGAEVARFQYDALGRRIEKIAGSVTTTYLYDGMDILREAVTSGGTTTTYRYTHGPGVDEPLVRENMTTGAVEYYHADGLGSIVKMTNSTGAVAQTRQYDAYGNLEAGADQPGFAYTGREWDPETGLYYYRARYYDPQSGRFTGEDPRRLGAGDINVFAYVRANPILLRDPSGEFCVPCVAVGLAIFYVLNNPTVANTTSGPTSDTIVSNLAGTAAILGAGTAATAIARALDPATATWPGGQRGNPSQDWELYSQIWDKLMKERGGAIGNRPDGTLPGSRAEEHANTDAFIALVEKMFTEATGRQSPSCP